MGNSGLKVANKLRLLRAEKNVTQEELAGKVGVTRVTINCIENNVYLHSLELALKISRFFARNVEEVFIVEENSEQIKNSR